MYKNPTHAIVFDIPVENSLGEPFEPWPDDVPTHLLTLTPDGMVVWDGEPVNQAELLARIEGAVAAFPREGIVYEPHAYASYDLAARVMALLTDAGATEQRFCLGGLRQYSDDLDEADGRMYPTSIDIGPQWEMLSGLRETKVGCEEAL